MDELCRYASRLTSSRLRSRIRYVLRRPLRGMDASAITMPFLRFQTSARKNAGKRLLSSLRSRSNAIDLFQSVPSPIYGLVTTTHIHIYTTGNPIRIPKPAMTPTSSSTKANKLRILGKLSQIFSLKKKNQDFPNEACHVGQP